MPRLVLVFLLNGRVSEGGSIRVVSKKPVGNPEKFELFERGGES